MEHNRIDVKRLAKQKPAMRTPSGAAVMQSSVTEAIEAALFDEWAEKGYAAISMEAVAKRAGVGKAAIYRRWSSKLALASDLLSRVGRDMTISPDTGDLRGDVRSILRQLRRMLRHPLIARILPDLHAEMPRTPELADAIRTQLQSYRREKAEIVLRRAIDRRELSNELDIDLAIDLLGSMIYWRMIVTRQGAGKAYFETLVDFVVAALKSVK